MSLLISHTFFNAACWVTRRRPFFTYLFKFWLIYPNPVANHFHEATLDQGSSIKGSGCHRSRVPEPSRGSNRRLPATKTFVYLENRFHPFCHLHYCPAGTKQNRHVQCEALFLLSHRVYNNLFQRWGSDILSEFSSITTFPLHYTKKINWIMTAVNLEWGCTQHLAI